MHVNVIAPVDLGGLAALIKPAVLYADRVTIHSPAAALVHGVTQFADITDPAEQMIAIVELSRQVPSALPMDFDPESVATLALYLRMPPAQKAQFRRSSGAMSDLKEIDRMVDRISRMWEEEMPAVVEEVTDASGARDLLVALRAGAVEIAPLGTQTPTDHVSGTLAAVTTPRSDRELDPVFDGFLDTIIEIVSGADGFPLLDSDAAGLVQAMERESLVVFDGSTARRSSEVDAATRFMALLPYFPQMPLDEVLDLKHSLGTPLIRFRGEMVKLARDFGRPIDATFVGDVEAAWRQSVAPAVTEIREGLAEHGLLQGIQSVALGDVKSLAAEAGAVWAASHNDVLDLSGLLTAAAATAAPTLHILSKAVKERVAARRDASKQGFYFLHHIDEAARRA